MRSLCILIGLAFFATGPGTLKGQTGDAPARATAPQARGFERLIEAESFSGVAEPVQNAKGQLDRARGQWTKFQRQGFSKGEYIRGPGEEVSHDFEVPADGVYYFWVYHVTHPTLTTTFSLFVSQKSGKELRLDYSEKLASNKHDEPDRVYRPGSWDTWSVKSATLTKGPVHLTIGGPGKPVWNATVDVIFVTDDPDYKPVLMKGGKWDTFLMDDR